MDDLFNIQIDGDEKSNAIAQEAATNDVGALLYLTVKRVISVPSHCGEKRAALVQQVRDLLAQGASTRWVDKQSYNYIALHIAAFDNDLELVRLLVRADRESIHVPDRDDETPLLRCLVRNHVQV